MASIKCGIGVFTMGWLVFPELCVCVHWSAYLKCILPFTALALHALVGKPTPRAAVGLGMVRTCLSSESCGCGLNWLVDYSACCGLF